MGKKMISLEIPDELREALRIEAFKRNVTISKLIRGILEEQLKVTASGVNKDDKKTN